jgi:hypothetical protein
MFINYLWSFMEASNYKYIALYHYVLIKRKITDNIFLCFIKKKISVSLKREENNGNQYVVHQNRLKYYRKFEQSATFGKQLNKVL